MRVQIISSLNWPDSHFTFCMSARFLQLRQRRGFQMNEKDPGEWTSNDKLGLPEDKKRAATIRAKLIPLVRALARTAARDWLDKVTNDNSGKLTQDKAESEQE